MLQILIKIIIFIYNRISFSLRVFSWWDIYKFLRLLFTLNNIICYNRSVYVYEYTLPLMSNFKKN